MFKTIPLIYLARATSERHFEDLINREILRQTQLFFSLVWCNNFWLLGMLIYIEFYQNVKNKFEVVMVEEGGHYVRLRKTECLIGLWLWYSYKITYNLCCDSPFVRSFFLQRPSYTFPPWSISRRSQSACLSPLQNQNFKTSRRISLPSLYVVCNIRGVCTWWTSGFHWNGIGLDGSRS